MNISRFAPILFAGLLVFGLASPSLADRKDITIKDGFGEEITIKNGWFGRKERVIKDRLGDKVSHKTGFFGAKDTEVNLAGNTFRRKKGWFGGSDVELNSILGDKIATKKSLLGKRETTVDLSGVSALVRDLFGSKKSTQPGSGFPLVDPLPSQAGSGGLSTDLPPELMKDPGQAAGDLPPKVPADSKVDGQ